MSCFNIEVKCNDYLEKEYMIGEIPTWKRHAPEKGDDIVYSANKYRETDGKKGAQHMHFLWLVIACMQHG